VSDLLRDALVDDALDAVGEGVDQRRLQVCAQFVPCGQGGGDVGATQFGRCVERRLLIRRSADVSFKAHPRCVGIKGTPGILLALGAVYAPSRTY